MKIILAVCALALTVGYVQAQTTAGRMMIGGNVGYTSVKDESYAEIKTTRFTFNPQFGYFVADNLAVGLEVNYWSEKSNYTYDGGAGPESKYHGTTIAPFVRYYMFTPNEKFAFYADAAVGVGSSKYEGYPTNFKNKTFTTRLSPGFSFFFNEKWALDLQLSGISYSSNDRDLENDEPNSKNSVFTFGVSSLNPSLGFRYFMGK
jgi:hypothetical protein